MELNELSVIAEDEEPSERTRSSTSGRDTEKQKSPFSVLPEFPSVPEHIPVPSVDRSSNSLHQESVVISTLDADTFHSISLGSPDSSANQIDRNRHSNNSEPMIVDTPSEHGLPKDCQDESNHKPEDDTTSLLSKPSEKVPPSFPTLPEPMPLRKSTRIRDPPVSAVMLGVATPGAAAKRTSWLAKAREVKALEGTVKKSHMPAMTSTSNAMPVSALQFLQGTKRKSGEMLAETQLGVQEETVVQKVAKIEAGETAPRNLREKSLSVLNSNFEELSEQFTKNSTVEPYRDPDTSQEVVLHQLKKAVEGLGVRASKMMGKSLGGDAATALAEAKAAAEARLAERDRLAAKGSVAVAQEAALINSNVNDDDKDVPMHSSLSVNMHGGRLSVSDLFPKEGHIKEKHNVPEKVFHKLVHPPVFSAKEVENTRMSTSTTPPNSPPLQSTRNMQGEEPPYTKPAPVFVPPAPALVALEPPAKKETFTFRPASSPKYNVPSSIALGFGPLFPSPKNKVSTMPLTAQSTVESVQSEIVFDDNDGPAWMPNTQDTEFTSTYGSQSQPHTQVCDEDDSWPVDEKLAAGVQWTYGVSKEDSMTWSTLPSQSQRADTGPITKTSTIREEVEKSTHVPGGLGIEANNEDLIPCDEELEEIVLRSKSTVSLVKVSFTPRTLHFLHNHSNFQQPEPARSESQMSMASSESSQSQVGFFGQASKFLSSALGTSKKKPEVKKVLQMAAVAAKKVRCFHRFLQVNLS